MRTRYRMGVEHRSATARKSGDRTLFEVSDQLRR
jgi:hypothetical protein